MKSPEYVVHGSSSEKGVDAISEEGFKTKEGFPNVSTNLIYAFKWASEKSLTKDRPRNGTENDTSEEGRILLIKVPDGLKVGYGYNTEIHVDTEDKEISGHTKNYVSGRNQLGVWNEKSDDQVKGSHLNVGAENVVLSIKPSEELGTVLGSLKHDIWHLEDVDPESYAYKVSKIAAADTNKYSAEQLFPTFYGLVKSTVESELINMMRSLSMKVAMEKSFQVYNNDEPFIDKNPMTKDELEHRLQSIKSRSDTVNYGEGTHGINRFLSATSSYLLDHLEDDKKPEV